MSVVIFNIPYPEGTNPSKPIGIVYNTDDGLMIVMADSLDEAVVMVPHDYNTGHAEDDSHIFIDT